ncbi:hypothetical protein C8Q76DRAFT_619937, partial [Earliella scabrosa]
MECIDSTTRQSFIREWQDKFATDRFRQLVCASCARGVTTADAKTVDPRELDLTLLRNDALPLKVRPTTYDFELYDRAILCPYGLTDRWMLAPMTLCPTCCRELVGKTRMPKLCLANWLYYGTDELPSAVKSALAKSSQFDRLLVARARASKISYRFTELRKDKPYHPEPGHFVDPTTAQRFVKGNVLVMPQNSTMLNRVLPPSPTVIRDTVCAIFVGRMKPTKQTIGKISPILARKSTIRTIIEFLIAENDHYSCDTTFHGFSEDNLNRLFDEDDSTDAGVPCAMEIGFLEDTEANRSVNSDYTTRNEEVETPADGEDILMENVGYTSGDDSPVSYRDMKMKALMHCLTGGRFVRSQAGDRFIPDFENPSLLTWMFPHLDPWGIGGFHHPHRRITITLEDQLRYLLQIHDSPFTKDADFAFVYYNILQKKAVCDSVHFRVKASQQREIVTQLLNVDRSMLGTLIEKFKRDPKYDSNVREEIQLLSLVNKVGGVLHDLPGTSGYKIRMRNEIRALVNHKGTPAFFVTLNPSDVQNPLVRLFAEHDISLESIERGQELSEWGRKLLVARNPAACARFFHTMITGFIEIILRYGREESGLFG